MVGLPIGNISRCFSHLPKKRTFGEATIKLQGSKLILQGMLNEKNANSGSNSTEVHDLKQVQCYQSCRLLNQA